MNSVPLPPLERSAAEPALGRRLANLFLVVFLHVILLYAVLYLSVKNQLIDLPASISVRLLPMIQEKPQEAPAPQPARPKPAEHRPPVVRPEPVLAAKSETAAPTFSVAPQPAVPAPQTVPTPAPAAPLVAARFDADYLHNPKPVYPALSRRRGEEGKVLLKVRVSAQGEALHVALQKSSGFDSLDAAATDAVSRWRFVPARRGEETVESTVLVPITFALE